MRALWQDLRFGLRTLARTPGFTLVTALTLGLGIGATSAIYSVVNAVLLRPLPYRDASRLVVPVSVNVQRGADASSVTYADYLDWRKAQVFDSVAAIDNTLTSADLSGGNGEPERVHLAIVSEDYFKVLRAEPVRGRLLAPDDYAIASGPARALVISEGLWKSRYGGDPEIVGKDVYLNGRPCPVVGVVAARSTWPEDRDVFVPLAVRNEADPDLTRRDNMIFLAIARLKPGVSVEATDAVLAVMARRLETDHPESRTGWTNRGTPLLDYVVGGQMWTSLLMLLAAVGCVLLITCANVSSLLLTRATARGHEFAIRLAHGAGRLRLVQQLLTEGLLLALLGGGAGLLLAVWGVRILKSVVPENTPRIEEIGVGGSVLPFALGLSLLTALVCGVIPAWHAAGSELGLALRETSRTGERPQRRRLKNVLVVSEIALSLVLLVGAALLIRSFARVQHIDPGFEVERLVTMELNAPRMRYPEPPQIVGFYRDLIERVSATPGVSSAAVSSTLPLGGGGFYLGRVFLAEGWPEPPAGRDVPAEWNVVSPGYFGTVGMRLVRGRDFDARDAAEGNPVIIVSETLARSMFPGQDPLGKRIRSWRDENQLREIVGVVSDVRYFGRDDELRGLVYVPQAQNVWRSMALNVRTRGDPDAVVASIRASIRALDSQLAVANLSTMTRVLERSVAPRRASMTLLAIFAGLAALLAAIGLYSVVAQTVLQRVHEIGIRMALGARTGDVARMVVGQGMRLAALGIGIGLAGALALTRFMRGLLYEVSATDPVSYAAIAAFLTLVALLACYLPARRAARVDPLVALRHE